MAQIKLYAALMNDMEEAPANRDAWRLRLIYLHPDDGAATHFEETHQQDDLAKFLADTVAAYTAWLAATAARIDRRNACLSRLPFPFADFRDSQRRLARGAYRAFRDREQLLVGSAHRQRQDGGHRVLGVARDRRRRAQPRHLPDGAHHRQAVADRDA